MTILNFLRGLIIVLIKLFKGIKLTGESSGADVNEKCDDGDIKTAQVCRHMLNRYQVYSDIFKNRISV